MEQQKASKGESDTQFFIVGDVHGCFNTFRELVQQHWRPHEETLIQIGDLIDRGNFSPETIAMARTLKDRFQDKAIFLKGNHEFEAVLYHETRLNPGWLDQGGSQTLKQYKQNKKSISDDLPWLKALPLCFETPTLLVSHAGVTETPDPYKETNSRGVLWNRTTLKNIGKLQIIGHTPLAGKPEYRSAENVWNIDTGAYRGNTLTAIRINSVAKVVDIISVPTNQNDFKKS